MATTLQSILSQNEIARRGIEMVITLTPELDATQQELARRQGIAPEILALDALRDRLNSLKQVLEPKDDWERSVILAASDCGVSLPHQALGSEGLYE